MGMAVVKALFGHLYMDYIIFTLGLWTLIYVWATPTLLIPVHGGGIGARLRALCNPMFICIIIGIVLGLSPINMPAPIMSAIGMASDCMSPLAMLLTGITIATVDIKAGFKSLSTWLSCALRLVVIPLVALLLFKFLPLPTDYLVCAFCTLAMPVGLSPIVIPAAYGKDTSLAASMALVSHILSVVTLPLIFMLMQRVLNI
jgi:predicted permease